MDIKEGQGALARPVRGFARLKAVVSAFWTRLVETGHVSSAVILFRELWSSFVGPIVAGVVARNKLEDPIVVTLFIIVCINSGITIHFYLRSRKEHDRTIELLAEKDRLELVDRENAAALKAQLNVNIEIVRRFTAASNIATTLAEDHSLCDKGLFEAMYPMLTPRFDKGVLARIGIMSPMRATAFKAREKVMSEASYLIKADVTDTLEKICLYLNAYTEDTCAACIKFYRIGDQSRDFRDARVVTEYRDSTSKGRRQMNEREYGILDNTITKRIFFGPDPRREWGNDDLKNCEDYENLRPNWQNYYNATLGVGIVDYSNGKLPSPYAAILCVDNFKGALNNPVCRDFLLREAFRLAAMFHRLRRLSAASD